MLARFAFTVAVVAVAASASFAQVAPPLPLDLQYVPLSHDGSYLTLAHLTATDTRSEGLYLRSVRGATDHQSMLLFETLRNGAVVRTREHATALGVRLQAEGGAVELAFDGPGSVRVRSSGGLSVRVKVVYLRDADDAWRAAADRVVLNVASNKLKLMLQTMQGQMEVVRGQAPKSLGFIVTPGADDVAEVAIDEFHSTWRAPAARPSFERLGPAIADKLSAWRRQLPRAPIDLEAGARMASFILWSNRVGPRLLLSRKAIFSTKNTLIGDWGWDHAFHALALAAEAPDAAWDELMVVLEAQDEYGAIPDRLNDTVRTFDFTKPPVQGWALRRMMKDNPQAFIKPARTKEVYVRLVQQAQWWLSRDDDHDGLPQYEHGNDSGWDNASPFVLGVPLESPDLASYLAVKMDVLADLAGRLGKQAEAREWKQRSTALIEKMLSAFWRADRFVATLSGTDRFIASDSLLLWVPLILGNRLPAAVRSSLLNTITKFVTAQGLATEWPQSPLYEPDGYWRGPVWGPSTLLIVDGLLASGARDLALQVARAYCRTLQSTSMPENYDALTGQPRKDTAFSWTAAAYLVLAGELATGPQDVRR
ncbi:MAG: trehalase family glycosidase [Deltaproteobacteria bacterium]|nr:trehalase family glycosidase [Deltaproteobacteria bacterium]